jgi:hypothetical protein
LFGLNETSTSAACALKDKRSEQRRVDRAATGRPVLKRRHVMNFHQGAGLVENRDGALYADVNAEDHLFAALSRQFFTFWRKLFNHQS